MDIFDHIRAGVTASELFRVCADGMAKRNLPFSTPHIGHSLGLECHEFPMLSPVEEMCIRDRNTPGALPVQPPQPRRGDGPPGPGGAGCAHRALPGPDRAGHGRI